MKKQKKIIQPNLDITPGGPLKRTGAVFIDLVIMYLLMNILWFAIHPIYNKVYDYENIRLAHERDMKRSNLVVLESPLLPDESNIDTVKIASNQLPVYKRGEAVFKFYTIFMREEQEAKLAAGEIENTAENNNMFTVDWYFKFVAKPGEEDSIYVEKEDELMPAEAGAGENSEPETPKFDPFVPEGLEFKEGVTAEEINDFNTKNYSLAIKAFSLRPNITILNKVNTRENILLTVLASSVIFLVFPLFFKNGQTLGKKIFKLGVTNRHGYTVSGWLLLARYFAFLFVNLLSNLIIPIVLPFISITIMTFSKERRSAHDFIASTKVVDLANSTIYHNEEEFIEIQKSLNPRLAAAEDVNEEVFSERFDEESGA